MEELGVSFDDAEDAETGNDADTHWVQIFRCVGEVRTTHWDHSNVQLIFGRYFVSDYGHINSVILITF